MQLIRTTNISTDPLRASCRNNTLSFSFNDGTDWGQAAGNISANRLLRIDLSAFPSVPHSGDPGYRERLFGLNNPIEDQPGERFSYAWPVVDTNSRNIFSRNDSTDSYTKARFFEYCFCTEPLT
jgi:hypothetical protein